MKTFLIAFAISYLFHTLGITLGYHRLLSHRSLRVPKWLEYLIVAGGYLCLEGSPIFWVSTHRLHHRYSDHPGDPHSPIDGVWHAFISWMWDPTVLISSKLSREMAPDLYRDPVYRALHCGHTHWDGKLCLLIGVLFRVLIFFVFGPVVLAANVIASMLGFLGPLLVNSFAHLRRFGYETYPCGDDSRNVWFVALLSLGEGWHNNHHAFPISARHGIKPLELDMTWLAIRTLKLLGLARDIKLPRTPTHVAFVARDAEVVVTSR